MDKVLSAEKITMVLDNSRATILLEGLVPDEATEVVTKKYLAGEISEAEALGELDVISKKLLL